MKILIEFDCENAVFEDDFDNELLRVLGTVAKKVVAQRNRRGGAVCVELEADDLLHDINGNRIGTVRVVGVSWGSE